MASLFQQLKDKYNQVRLNGIKSLFYVPTSSTGIPFRGGDTYTSNFGGSKEESHNVANFLAPVPALRIKQDADQWRLSIQESERPILPFRYKMQIAYLDTVLDPHLSACIQRRKNLTLLRNFRLVDESGNINEEWSNYFDKGWFHDFMNHTLDALFYGYSLISMGDIVDNNFENVTVIRRCNISPDRLNVAPVPYSPDGVNFLDEPYADWHIWVETSNEHGLSSCGYGLLYPATILVILLKNNLIYNSEYVEVYGMPFRQLKTDKKDEEERRQAEVAMQNMASNNFMITSKDDEIIFHDISKGEGYKSYSELETRLEKKISKLILGHSDALDSVPGKLGASSGADSPVTQALYDLQAADANFVLPIVNQKLLPLMRKHGINIPENLRFEFSNDDEKTEEINQMNDQLQKLANIALTLANAGYEMDLEYFEKATGIQLARTIDKKEIIDPVGTEEVKTGGSVKIEGQQKIPGRSNINK